MSNLYGTLPIDNVIDLRDVKDLPTAVSGSHIIPANTTIYLNAEIDLGVNNLAPLGNLNVFGNGNFNSTLTSSNASGTIDLGTNVGTINLTNMIIDNTNATNIAIALDNAGSSLICERINAFADWVIGDFQFVNMERVTHFASQRFVKNAPFGTYTASISAFIQLSPINSIEIEAGATMAEMNITFDVLFITTAGGHAVLVEDAASVLRGSFNELEFLGTGIPLASKPISSSKIASPGFAPDCIAVDNDGHLLIGDLSTNTIYKMVGITAAIGSSITTPGFQNAGILWAKGNLISADAGSNLISVHDGFSNIITSSFSSPATDIRCMTFDGTNLITVDAITKLIYVHDGISATILRTFDPGLILPRGITFDGVNLIVTDTTANLIHVMDGISGVTKYTFIRATTSEDPTDVVVTDTGFAYCDFVTNEIFLYDHSVTFDHTSPTWGMTNLGGLVPESADRGGSQFTDPGAIGFDVAVTQNIWTDISDSGANIFYGSFSAMEKCRLNNELNGEIIWTGARDRGRILSGLATITRLGNATNRFYQIGISINGVIQRDSIASGVLPDSSTFITLSTIPVTRDLTKNDVVKLQIRNVTDTESPKAVSAKTAIN